MSHATYNAFMNKPKPCLALPQSAWALLLLLVISILKSAEAQTAQPLLEPCGGEACGKFTISTNSDWTDAGICSIDYIWYQNLPWNQDQCWCANSWACGTGQYAEVWFNNDWYSISQVGVRGCALNKPEYVKTFKVGYHNGSDWKFVGGSTYESATLYNSSSTCSENEQWCSDGTPNDIPATSCKGIRLYPMSVHESCSTNMEIHGYPISSPTSEPSLSPTVETTKVPTNGPTDIPSASPTASPTQQPTTEPTIEPTTSPTQAPTMDPSNAPTTLAPTLTPALTTATPTRQPTKKPILVVTSVQGRSPTGAPTSPLATASNEDEQDSENEQETSPSDSSPMSGRSFLILFICVAVAFAACLGFIMLAYILHKKTSAAAISDKHMTTISTSDASQPESHRG